MKHIFIPLRKVDEAQRLVYGIAAVEQVDKTREILDYDSSKPLFESWSAEFAKATNGLSLGNVREMHGKSAAGKLVQFAPNDADKSFEVCAKVVDDQAWTKVLEGVYTGFSIGGDYARKWDDPSLAGVKRYTAKPSEVSLVDNPCIPGATFEAIKADGSTELRKFAEPTVESLQKRVAELERLAKAGKTKTVAGASLSASDFAYVGDPEDTSTWKLPVHDASHAQDALARFNQAEIPADQKEKVARRLAAAAKKHGIDASGFAEEHVKAAYPRALAKRAELKKSLYDVGSLASMLQSLAYMEDSLEYEREREGDNSPIPQRLRDVLQTLKQIFVDLATEEANELVAEDANKAAQAAELQKSASAAERSGSIMATINTTLEERLQKATPSELAKYAGKLIKAADHLKTATKNLEKAQAAHEKMGDHLDGMADCIGKAASAGTLEKANGDHLTGHLTGLRESHGAMEDAHDGIEGALDDLAAVAAEDVDENESAASRKSSEKMLKRIEKNFEKRLEKGLKQQSDTFQATIDALNNGIKKAFGLADSAAPAVVPARTDTGMVTVDKAQDGSGVTKAAPAVPQAATVVATGNTTISPTLPDGMPNPEYLKMATSADGTAFHKAAVAVKPQVGNPFPENFGKAL